MKNLLRIFVAFVLLVALMWPCLPLRSAAGTSVKPAGPYYGVFREIPMVDITPEGWLKEFLTRQRDGLGLHHAVGGFPFNTCMWAGVIPHGAWGAYEQSGYLVDGVFRAGLLLKDKALTDLGMANVRYVLDHPQKNGQLGPGQETIGVVGTHDIGTQQWPFAVFTRALIAYYEATGDRALLDALTKHYLTLPEDFGKTGRDVNNVEGMCWLYGQTGDPAILALAERTWKNSTKSPHNQFNLANLTKESLMKGHGVSVCEETKQPALLYLYTGKKEYLDGSLGGFRSLVRDHELVDGVVSSDEALNGKAPQGLHETCDISDYSWSLGYLLEAGGDAYWGDKVERAVFNAGFGALDKEFKAHEYFSSPNQVVATQHSSAPEFGPANADRQAYRPGFAVQCCTGNVHRFLPNFTARLWMSDNKGGLAATLYAPNRVNTLVGSGDEPVTIDEKTDYPFSGAIELAIHLKKPVQFPLYLRIPGWVENPTVTLNGKPVEEKVAPGTFVKLDRTFADGDVVKLNFPMPVRIEQPVPNGITLLRGPLVYSLKIKEDKTAVTKVPNTAPGYPAWDITAGSPWNYAIDIKGPEDLSKIKVDASPVTAFPWTPDSAPVVLTVPAHKVNGWTLTPQGKNPALPAAPLQLAAETEQVQLVPDGATQLRMSVFPSLNQPAPAQ